jgi:hypothetical protein
MVLGARGSRTSPRVGLAAILTGAGAIALGVAAVAIEQLV